MPINNFFLRTVFARNFIQFFTHNFLCTFCGFLLEMSLIFFAEFEHFFVDLCFFCAEFAYFLNLCIDINTDHCSCLDLCVVNLGRRLTV